MNQYSSKNGKAAQANSTLKKGIALERLEHIAGAFEDYEIVFKAIRFKGDFDGHGEVMMIVTAFIGGDDVVAFRTASGVGECLIGFVNAVMNGTVNWKEDQYAKSG